MTGHARISRAKTRCAAAFREAGHAVAAWDRHVMLFPVSIVSGTEGAGGNVWNDALRNVDFEWVANAEFPDLVEQLAAILLAGTVAQDAFAPGSPKGRVRKNRLREAKTILGALPDGADGKRTRYENLRDEVEAFLMRHDVADAVAVLANTLLDRGTVPGDEVERIIGARCRRR